MNESPVLRLDGLSKRFGATAAVRGVSLSVQEGEILALLGPSGCGKTTTLRLVAGLEIPDSGTIEIGGRVVAGPRWVPPEARRVGLVFQDLALFPHLTVAGNVAFGLRGLGRAERRDRVARLLAMIGLPDAAARYPHELSGGQQQRVALARALATAPALLLLDEPFSNLDPTLRGQVLEEVRALLRDAGTTALFVTHDHDEAFAVADRVAVMREGAVEQLAGATDVYFAPASPFVATFAGGANVFTIDADACAAGTGSAGGTRTPFGDLPLDGIRGRVQVIVRPEALALEADPLGPAVVQTRRFYGHDVVYDVRAGENVIQVREMSSDRQLAPGERVRVVRRGPVALFDELGNRIEPA